ncbi:peptidylprolyl isomerase [Marinospirillum sp.]|uniref:FKBP-type peptidyl-prolyl cis-trans isomerase n=1 Tax=Marinospirillum sp. TaxID=2183934 RepID=UPI00384E3ADB
MKISNSTQVTADYHLLNEEGQCLNPDAQTLHFQPGKKQLLPALEEQLLGCEVGDSKRITLEPEQAFGPHRPELVFEAVKEHLPPGDIQPGMTFSPGGQQGKFTLRVVKLTEQGALLDGNHPLAGQTLTWEIEVQKVEPAVMNPRSSIDHQPLQWKPLNG